MGEKKEFCNFKAPFIEFRIECTDQSRGFSYQECFFFCKRLDRVEKKKNHIHWLNGQGNDLLYGNLLKIALTTLLVLY